MMLMTQLLRNLNLVQFLDIKNGDYVLDRDVKSVFNSLVRKMRSNMSSRNPIIKLSSFARQINKIKIHGPTMAEPDKYEPFKRSFLQDITSYVEVVLEGRNIGKDSCWISVGKALCFVLLSLMYVYYCLEYVSTTWLPFVKIRGRDELDTGTKSPKLGTGT